MKQILYPNSTKNLREALESEGFRFPCGGKGLCGRCRILAPSLLPTALDRRFFSEEDLARGMRLACDKTFESPLELEVLMEKSSKKRKLYEASVFALLGDTATEVSILEDNERIESVILPSPAADTISLRALVGKNAIELFEKYGVAKASTMLVAGTAERMASFCQGTELSAPTLPLGDTLPATYFNMPAEEVYLPPFPNAAAGSLELLELDGVEDGSLLLCIGKRYTILYKGTVTVACSSLIADTDEQNTRRAVAAAIQYYIDTFAPYHFYYIGDADTGLLLYLKSKQIFIKQKDSAAAERAQAAVYDNRYKTRLDKLARKSALITLAEEEKFLALLGRLS